MPENETSSGAVTRLLLRWGDGDASVSDQLVPLIYDELRRMARSYLRRERPSHTLQPTALVHEAFLRLTGDSQLQPKCRAHFFGIASTTMRRVLVEHARAKNADKRGGGARVEGLDGVDVACGPEFANILELDRALSDLSKMDARKARLVELKYFAGMTIDEMSETVGISTATVERDLKMAQAWLHQRLRPAPKPS